MGLTLSVGTGVEDESIIGAAAVQPTLPLVWETSDPAWADQCPLSSEKLHHLHELIEAQLTAGHIIPVTSPVFVIGKLKTSCKRECINLGCNTDIDLSGPTISGWAVLGYADWLAAYQMASDKAISKLSQNNFALGYKAGGFQLHVNVNDGTEFGGSVYQKVNNEAETSVHLAWTAGSSKTCFGIAAEYQLNEKTSTPRLPRATSSLALNNASLIGIGDTLALQPGVKLSFSGFIDGKSFSAGGHKVGLGFELEA
ncbi:non-selective voltage-gated ion channel VDAC3-like [Excalfactoria chinensis]|uniref:non-selective voltage-gated ion channel VDAC3-like n=1 Tax=Excalfactoria chinensis TaxID=46218 RepID=UPI003B39FB00